MNVFIDKVRVSDPDSPHHGEEVSILFEDGSITEINGSPPKEADHIIDEEDLWISPGWVDLGARSGEPGFEQRETLNTLAEAGRSGGFTRLLIFPNTNPVLDSKTDIEFINRKADQIGMSILPVGAATVGCKGERITEMIDLHKAGARAFSDGIQPIQNAATLLKALEYVKTFDGLIIQHPSVESLRFSGIMHEGSYSLRLGLRGIPPLSETVAVQRELDLLDYSDSRLLLYALSSKESLDIIHSNSGEQLMTSVAAANLLFTDRSLTDYDPNFKVLPPLRSESDRLALIQGIRNGSIDMIVSNHQPVEKEQKEIEFQHAAFGMTALLTSFAAARTATKSEIKTDHLVQLFAHNPRRIFDLPNASVQAGSPADHTLFQPGKKWTVERKHLKSKSSNTPYIGRRLTGKAFATLWKKGIYFSS